MQYGPALSGLLRLRVTLAAEGWHQRAWLHTPSVTAIYEDDQHPITEQAIPKPVWECLHVLRAAGHEVLLVGGAVRDLLLQHCEPKDYDLLTTAQLKQVIASHPYDVTLLVLRAHRAHFMTKGFCISIGFRLRPY
jgi:hypothetical protein